MKYFALYGGNMLEKVGYHGWCNDQSLHRRVYRCSPISSFVKNRVFNKAKLWNIAFKCLSGGVWPRPNRHTEITGHALKNVFSSIKIHKIFFLFQKQNYITKERVLSMCFFVFFCRWLLYRPRYSSASCKTIPPALQFWVRWITTVQDNVYQYSLKLFNPIAWLVHPIRMWRFSMFRVVTTHSRYRLHRVLWIC